MIIAFSFLSLLKNNYKEAIEKYNSLTNTDWLHFDVMDGKFVSNKTFNYRLVKKINKYNKCYKDVHLMINKPSKVIEKYQKAGTDSLTFHYEAIDREDILTTINRIKEAGMKVGISIKPKTDVKVLDKYLPYLDNILIMSVEPGKGGQKFMENSLDKIKYLKSKQKDNHYLISVDGGINDKTSKLVKEAGADVIIVGTYLANNLNKKTMDDLR